MRKIIFKELEPGDKILYYDHCDDTWEYVIVEEVHERYAVMLGVTGELCTMRYNEEKEQLEDLRFYAKEKTISDMLE